MRVRVRHAARENLEAWRHAPSALFESLATMSSKRKLAIALTLVAFGLG